MTTDVIILAAGAGTRMQSDLPKVLHPLAGKPLLQHILDSIRELHIPSPIIIDGHGSKSLRAALPDPRLRWIHQAEQAGTAHAVLQALPQLQKHQRALILYGDAPLIHTKTLQRLLDTTPTDAVGFITAHVPNPAGFGRIMRNAQQHVTRIVEEKDATDIERAITEINAGIYVIPVNHLQRWLPIIKNHNAQQEYYLPDILPLAIAEKIAIHTVQPVHYQEILGINTRSQLAQLERFYQLQQAEKWMAAGITLLDPARFDVRGDVVIERDSVMDINVILEGTVRIGKRCQIGAGCILRNVTLADDCEIRPYSHIDGAMIGAHAIIGPFARIRPETTLAEKTHIGNFVEVKNSKINVGSKVNHLSYVGDSEIGLGVNVGAGTITANYDGVRKNKTCIQDHASIGSNVVLVAPLTVHAGATIGAGSVITRDAPAGRLTVARARQQSIEGWIKAKE